MEDEDLELIHLLHREGKRWNGAGLPSPGLLPHGSRSSTMHHLTLTATVSVAKETEFAHSNFLMTVSIFIFIFKLVTCRYLCRAATSL